MLIASEANSHRERVALTVANLEAQADSMVATMEDHSRQLGELSVMMQMMQEMMGTQQE